MDRDTFLARVRTAAQAGRAYRVPTQEIPDGVGYVGARGDVCEHFAREVNEVGGRAVVVADDQAARVELRQLLVEHAAQTALAWQHPVVERIAASLCAELNIALHQYESLAHLPAAEQRALILSAGIGITSVELAIAETGTLLMWSQPGQERVASLVPPVHVALVDEAQIVPDLFDAFAVFQQRGLDNLPSNVAFITGPSKTGDIELQLTTGVHGPKHWHVIVIRSTPRA
jgi:L-lactate dehydrogenase complex protein LldG